MDSCVVLAAYLAGGPGSGPGRGGGLGRPDVKVGPGAIYGYKLVPWPSFCYDPLKTWGEICKKVT